MIRAYSVCSIRIKFNIVLVSVKWEGFIKFINAYTHRQRNKETIRKSWKEFKKATLKVSSHSALVVRSPPSKFFKKYCYLLLLPPPPTPPPPLLEIFFLSLTPTPTTATKMQKSFFSSSETFKILLYGCQYGHTIVRRNTRRSNKMCKNVFITNKVQGKLRILLKL